MAVVNLNERRAEALRQNALARTAVLEIRFEDLGQDFTWWKVDEQGNVVDCGPFQYKTWVGGQVLNVTELREDGKVEYQSQRLDYPIEMRYRVARLRQLP